MTSKMIVKRAKAVARLPLDLPMAALAAASVAFVAYAMPGDLLAGAVGMTGLPALVPAAQPPLGGTARAAIVALGAAGTFFAVWMMLRALGKRPRAAAAAPVSDLPDFDVGLRLRRADAHPDAPSRRPLFAGRDLGEPADPHADELELVDVLDLGAGEEFDTAATCAEYDGSAGHGRRFSESDDDLDADDEVEPMFRTAASPEEAEPDPTPASALEDEAPAPAFDAQPEPETYSAAEREFDAAPEPDSGEQPWSEPQPWPLARPDVSPAAPIRMEPVSPPLAAEEDDDTISSLMQRLERGLERRAPRSPRSVPAPVHAAPAATEVRLSAALGDLRKLAGRTVSNPRPSAPRS